MKTKINLVVLIVTVLAYWIGLCNASAFYDPGMQRWLNRDPIGEIGFEIVCRRQGFHGGHALSRVVELVGDYNPYWFVKNQPLQNIDPDGRYSLPPPPVQFRECDESEWTTANQRCKEVNGCWSIVRSCTAVKLTVDLGVIRANFWFLVVTCMNSAPDPMPPPPNVG